MKPLFGRILVPLDGSDMAERILPAAAFFAEAFGGKLSLLHILERGAAPTIHLDRHLTTEAEAQDYLALVAQSYSKTVESIHVHGPPEANLPTGIAGHAAEFEADAIAMTTHGHGGFSRMLFGTMAERTLAHGRIPMLVAPVNLVCPLRQYACARILVMIDIDEQRRVAAEVATEVAVQLGAKLRVLAVAATPSTLDTRRNAAARLVPGAASVLLERDRRKLEILAQKTTAAAARRGVDADSVVREGDEPKEILEEAVRFDADLVVLASYMRRGLEARWTSAISGQVAGNARTHLLLTPVFGAPSGD